MRRVLHLGCIVAALLNQVCAQSAAGGAAAQQPGYTLRAGTRIVLTDVTVTDRDGNPVRGLPASAFRIRDNNKPQELAFFEEHASDRRAFLNSPGGGRGVYSNDILLHMPPVVNILLLDITNIGIADQMYLRQQLTGFLNTLRKDEPIAMYLRRGDMAVMLQGFTSDRELLLTALRRAIPNFPPPGGEYLSDIDALHQLAIYLRQVAGRKNVLWFSGGSTLYLRGDPSILPDAGPYRALYDELETSRIAIYPVDARGLTTMGDLASQHSLMREVAEATGGHAYYNSNGLSEIAQRVVDTDGSFYTLTYSPRDFRYDNQWHKVRIQLDGTSYQLSYRRGYFADGHAGGMKEPGGPRTRLLADGTSAVEPEMRSAPIIFEARVLLASDPALVPFAASSGPVRAAAKKGKTPLSIVYSLPASAFTLQSVNGKQQFVLGAAVIAINREGRLVARRAEQFTLNVHTDNPSLVPGSRLRVEQALDLHKGDDYLYLAVWDMSTGRMGTLETPFQVPKSD